MASCATTSTTCFLSPPPSPTLPDPEVVDWQKGRNNNADDNAVTEVTRLMRALDANEIPEFEVQYSFDSADQFAQVHRNAAMIELANDIAQLKEWNDARHQFKSYVVSPLPLAAISKGFETRYIVLVDTERNALFPGLGDFFYVSFTCHFHVNGDRVDPGLLKASRIDNPFAECADHPFKHLAALRVIMQTFIEDGNDKNIMEPHQLCASFEDIMQARSDESKQVDMVITKSDSTSTYLAEIGALSSLTDRKKEAEESDTEPGPRAKAAFCRLVDFTQSPLHIVDIFSEGLEGMRQPHNNPRIPQLFKMRFRQMNPHHRAAYEGLQSVPDRLHLVTGCPGAGKTGFNLTVAALAMTAGPKRAKCLYVIDINSAATDVANRMHKLLRDAGVNKKAIRMRGFPTEMSQSGAINADEDVVKVHRNMDKAPDFSQAFVLQASITASRDSRRADVCPSLDEAAWDHFEGHREDFPELASALEKALNGKLGGEAEQLSLRSLVFRLYRQTLADADFVCTTPVAVASHFPKIYRPDIIFVDEAPHARELTSLIPIAFFEPKVWVLSGDHLQTRPFVANAGAFPTDTGPTSERHRLRRNPWAKQLAVSTMERAQSVNSVEHNLLINHRAFGNLQALPSRLFYGSRMISAYAGQAQFPEPVLRMKRWIERHWLHGRTAPEPRVLVHLRNAQETKVSGSWLNRRHHGWVMARVKTLLGLEKFVQVDRRDALGTILIITPYRAAHTAYVNAIKGLAPEHAARVQARTIDSSQGYEADVVIIDLVRSSCSSPFLEDAHRLNVALTRARACELILMQPRMKYLRREGKVEETQNLSQVWRHCEAQNLVVELGY